MKKLMALILALILAASLAACGGGETSVANGHSGNADSGNNTDSGNTPSAAEISLSGEVEGEITVSCYDTMLYRAFLEDAARLFEEKYPGTKVNVETFSAMPEIKTNGQGMIMATGQDDPQNRADYLNKINTALMSGGGADILAMDILPFYKYADGGQLENLAAYMQADPEFNRADYRANILDAVQYKNGTWFVPLDYSFHYYAYDATLLTGGAASGFGTDGKFTAEELVAIAEPFFDGSSNIFSRSDYARGSVNDMWSLLLTENYTSFVDMENKTASFDDGGFAALLESVRQYSELGYISKGMTGQSDAKEMMQRSGEETTDRFFFSPKNAINLVSLFTRDLGMSMTGMAEGGTMAVGDDDEIAGIEANADGSVPFTYSQAYGINSNSKNKETAWVFLKFLLSEEMQLNTNLRPTALPVSNSAREKKMETTMAGMMGQQGQALNEAQLEAIAKYNETVKQLSGQINAYVIRDTVIDDMIAVEAQYFFEGSKTAAEAASTLQNKVTLYLNE